MKLAFLLACCALPVQAATLKPFTSLPEAAVRLSDLWDGVQADRAIGPAPAPGGRITVEAPQLAAIARQFGVEWRPASGADRAVLDRPGRPLVREDVLEPLREALAAAGASRDSELELGALVAPPLPVGALPRITVQQMELDGASGRFTALLGVATDGAPASQLRLTGRVQEMVDLPVPRRRMLPGEVVGGDDLQWARLRVPPTRGELVRTPAQAIGQAIRHSVSPGQPILAADLGRPVVVQKGAAMLLSLDSAGIQLTAQAVATEPGGVGDRIRVLNPLSRIVVEAEITAPGRARVVPGTVARSGGALVAAR